MAEVQRRSTTGGEFGHERASRRKSGIFFFNRSFKKSASSPKGDNDSNGSAPTTPTLGPDQDGFDLKSTSPKTASISLGEAAQKSGSPAGSLKDAAGAEDLPTPPRTPGPSSSSGAAAAAAAATSQENDQAEVDGDEEEDGASDNSRPAEPEVEKKSFSEEADLSIRVRNAQGQEALYAVRSHVLESASRVWRASLPSRASDTIDLTSDPAAGLEVLFSIAHYRFQSLPRQLDAAALCGTAVAAERYEAVHLLSPFVRPWLACLEAAPEAQSDEVLVASYVLGDAPSFARTAARCAYHASLGPDGALLDARGRPWAEQPLAAEALDLLAAVRLSAVGQIIEAVSRPVRALLNPQPGPAADAAPRFCQAPGDDELAREECEQVQLGSAIMGLTRAGLWPPPAPESVRASPVDLARSYAGVRLRRSVEDGHARCGFGHQERFAGILARPAELTPAVVEQLVSRAKQSGVYEEDMLKALGGAFSVQEEEEEEEDEDEEVVVVEEEEKKEEEKEEEKKEEEQPAAVAE